MLKIIIIEDENNAVRTLQSYINKYVSNVSIVGIANNTQEGAALIKNSNFDLVLLDINLGDGNGFELLEKVKQIDFGVIFTTAYDEYAIKAFKYSAIDYLLKPINPDEFIKAIDRYKKGRTIISNQQLNIIKDNDNSKIVINSTNEIHFININDILHLKSDKNYTDIYLKNGERITSSKTLKFYEKLLSNATFFRIHQRHLVNLNYITKFLKEDGGYVLLVNNSKLEVSRRKKEELMNLLLK